MVVFSWLGQRRFVGWLQLADGLRLGFGVLDARLADGFVGWLVGGFASHISGRHLGGTTTTPNQLTQPAFILIRSQSHTHQTVPSNPANSPERAGLTAPPPSAMVHVDARGDKQLTGEASPAAASPTSLPVRSAAHSQAKFQEDLIDERRILGKGSYGVVKLFRQRSTGKHLAVKFVSLIGQQALQEWEREELAMQTLAASTDNSTKFIVRLYSSWVGMVGPTRTGMFVMEVCDRTVLDDILRRAPLVQPLLAALRWAHHLMRGLALIHSLNLLHRDLKPNNVMLHGLGDSAVLKIADMGSSRQGAALMTAAIATLPYRAPEILLGTEIVEAGPG